MKEIIGPIYNRKDYAGFIRRSVALVLDFIILSVFKEGVPQIWYYLAPPEWETRESYFWIYSGLATISFIYFIGFQMTEGGTPGYRIMRIRYAYMFSEKPTFLALAFRSLMAVVLLKGFFAFDHLWILGDPRKQAWHDKVSGFYVVKCRAQPIGTARMVQHVVDFTALSFMVWEPVRDELG